MKTKLLLLFIVALFASKLKSQCAIPDAGFENWTVSTYSSTFGPPKVYTYEHLTDSLVWVSFLDILNIGFGDSLGPSMQKTTDKYSGNYALKINADTNDYFGIVSGGFTCTTRNQNFNGYYKYNGGIGDTLIMNAYLYKAGSNFDGTRDSAIAYVEQIITTSASSYTNFSVPFTYNNGLTPDSAAILFMVLNNGNVERYALIDDISFSGTVAGVNEELAANSLLLYPNPAKDVLHILVPSDVVGSVLSVYDVSGQLIESVKINRTDEILSIEKYSSGVYSLRIATDNTLITKIFIKE